jgi:hypothetical protein
MFVKMVFDQALGLQLNDGHSCSSQNVVQQMMTQWRLYGEAVVWNNGEGAVDNLELAAFSPHTAYACMHALCRGYAFD